MDTDKTCTACKGPLHQLDEPPDYDPGDTDLCWECDKALYPDG